MELIDKDTLVAEIIKLDGSNCLESPTLSHNEDYKCGYSHALEKVRDFIDTLEVKEVDGKSTKHFPNWKPTQEQMSDLYHAATMNSVSCPSLKSLYNDLKVIAQKGE